MAKKLRGTARMTPREKVPTKGRMRVGGFGEKVSAPRPKEDVEAAIRGTGELKAFPSFEIAQFRRGAHRESALDTGRATWLGRYGIEIFRNPNTAPDESPWIVSIGGMKNIWVGWESPVHAVGFATGIAAFMEAERKDAISTGKATR